MASNERGCDVFISYAKARRRLTASLAKDLEKAGFTTWWDTDVLAGDDFRHEIESQLDGSKAAIIIWTPESIDSAWVCSEAGHALRQKKLINTHVRGVKLEDIPKPFDQFQSVKISDRAAIIEAVEKRIEAAGGPGKRPVATVSTPKARDRRPWLVGALAALLLICGVGAYILSGRFEGPPAPQWTFDTKPFFLGEAIPFAWSYQQPASAHAICFEVVSAADPDFQSDSRTETCTDANHYFAGDINGKRYWRVRAVDSRTGKPVSPWSPAIEIAQYDSVYERIKTTGEVDVFASRSQDQDVFKFVKNKGVQGVDFRLSQMILDELSKRLDRKLQTDWTSVAWEDLLPKAGEGVADYVVSSITKTPERERKFRVSFSDPYFCTGHALLYRAGTPVGPTREALAGKRVGVQQETTNAQVAEGMAGSGLFEVVSFPNTESLENALLGARIDFGITDTSFARAAQLDTRLGNGMDRLALKELTAEDMPETMRDAYKQEYAIAVRAGEIELLSTINAVIAKAKQDGALARAFKEAAEEYEKAFGLPPGSRTLSARPWECHSRTASGD